MIERNAEGQERMRLLREWNQRESNAKWDGFDRVDSEFEEED